MCLMYISCLWGKCTLIICTSKESKVKMNKNNEVGKNTIKIGTMVTSKNYLTSCNIHLSYLCSTVIPAIVNNKVYVYHYHINKVNRLKLGYMNKTSSVLKYKFSIFYHNDVYR